MIDSYIYVIVALLPLAALMLVFQANPYQALVIRAILGAVAALVYVVLGAADVALTEALVGTMLAVTLYVIAVRSSLVMRLGVIKDSELQKESYFTEIITNIRKVINKHYLRLEIVEYTSLLDLQQGLLGKEVHAICTKRELEPSTKDSIGTSETNIVQSYDTTIKVRVHRLFEIMQTEASLPKTTLTYMTVSNTEDKH
ncbi:MAG: DUF4040 domain-containing protein [Waterburya sp.]